MNRIALLLALLLAGCVHVKPQPVVYVQAPDWCTQAADPRVHLIDTRAKPRTLGAGTLTDRLSFLSGSTGTVTLATGQYALGVTGYATSDATITMTPCGPDIGTCTASPAVTVKAGTSFSYLFKGAPDEMGDGSVFVFGAGIATYTVAQWKYN
jgi:hypothetical protein